MRAPLALLAASALLGCSATPPLAGPAAADLVQTEIHVGMTKSQVKKILGEPRWSLPRLAKAAGDVEFQHSAGDATPGECWAWGIDAKFPDAAVCFSGADHRVVSKSP